MQYLCHKSDVKFQIYLPHTPKGLAGACLGPKDKVKGLDSMATPVSTRVTSAKHKTPRKTVADKNVGAAAKTVEKKLGAPSKRRTSPKRAATSSIRPEERHHLIEVAAYYLAERRGFHGASSHDDWLQAEREIDAMIEAGKFAA